LAETDYNRKFLRWLRTSCVVSIETGSDLTHLKQRKYWLTSSNVSSTGH